MFEEFSYRKLGKQSTGENFAQYYVYKKIMEIIHIFTDLFCLESMFFWEKYVEVDYLYTLTEINKPACH